MLQGLKINPHGAVGVVFIVLMFGIAFLLNWNVNWWYFSIAVVLYSAAVISMTNARADDRWLLGCHLTLLFWAVGLLLHFQDYSFQTSSGSETIPALLLGFFYFIASIFGGLTLPFLVLRAQGILHGLVALLLIIIMFGIAFLYNWNLGAYWLYFITAITLYVIACLSLNPDHLDYASRYGESPPSVVREQLGCHLAFIFLLVGFALHFKDVGAIIGFFIASIAIGLAIPYMLFRS